jgi:hypothetical protein
MRQPIAVLTVLALLSAPPSYSQPPAPAAGRVIRLNGSIAASTGAGTPEPVRFAIYDQASGGTLLWEETHTLRLDATGQYSVLLGTGSPDGLPADLFAADAARWLAVERAGVPAAPRTLLTAVPYAVAAATAADAASLGGRPAADYALTAEARHRDSGNGREDVGTGTAADSRAPVPLVNNGTTGYLGKFLNTQDLDSSALFQSGPRVGLGTTTPFDMFQSTFTNTTGSLTGYAVQNLGGTSGSYSGMLFYDHTGALRQFQGYNNGTGEYRINNISPSASINFMTNSASRFKVGTSGLIGIGAGPYQPDFALHLFGNTLETVGIRGQRFSGTIDALQPTVAGQSLLWLEGAGFTNGLGFTPFRAWLQLIASENWTDTANGTAIRLATTANGSLSTVERMRIDHNGRVGIGVESPQVPLDIAGGAFLNNSATSAYFFPASTALTTGYTSPYAAVTIRADNYVVGGGIAAASDARIKDIAGRSNGAADLQVLHRIEVTNYAFKDTVGRGRGPQKKVIAQQVEQVFPQAVSQMTDVVPDIFKAAELADGWVVLDTDLAVGDRIRLITDKGHRAMHTVTAVAPGRFRTDFAGDGGRLFVYGREVKDFRVVDYEAISMLNVSATQELARRLEQQTAETAALKDDVAQLRAALATALEALRADRQRQ